MMNENRSLLMDYRTAAKALDARIISHEKHERNETHEMNSFVPLCLCEKKTNEGFSSVVIDSRKAEPGALFVALKGEKSDGHNYIAQAFEKGAAAALVSQKGLEGANISPADFPEKVFLIVEKISTLAALQKLAAAYLDRFPGLVRAGITGSSGKTTTKEIAAAMLGAEKKVVVNEGNLNSETGLPLAAFTVRSEHQIGIFEAGMNRKGEIAELAAVLRPDFALITNIGPAHIGLLGSMEKIAAEKKNIFNQFDGKQTALVPEEDTFAEFLSAGVKGNVVLYGQRQLEAKGILGGVKSRGLAGTEITWEGIPAAFALPGSHNVKNALAAASLALAMGASGSAIRRGLESAKPLFGRGEIFRGETTVVRDCYNSNPDSAAAAIEFCDGVDWDGRRVYIIGSMLELGGECEAAHAELGKILADSKADIVFLYGKETSAAAEALRESGKNYFFAAEMPELKDKVAAQIKAGDLVLLKGSRGCALEQLGESVMLGENISLKETVSQKGAA